MLDLGLGWGQQVVYSAYCLPSLVGNLAIGMVAGRQHATVVDCLASSLESVKGRSVFSFNLWSVFSMYPNILFTCRLLALSLPILS